MSNIIPELGEKETLGMTDAICNMNKSDFDRLKYIQAIDQIEEELTGGWMIYNGMSVSIKTQRRKSKYQASCGV